MMRLLVAKNAILGAFTVAAKKSGFFDVGYGEQLILAYAQEPSTRRGIAPMRQRCRLRNFGVRWFSPVAQSLREGREEDAMRKLATISAVCVAAACSQGPATDTETVARTTANGSPPGTYLMEAADGTASLVTIYADGNYSQVMPDGSYPSRGTFEVVDGKTCFKVQQIGAEPNCFTESEPDQDGAYTAVLDSGEELTITPYTAEDVDVSE